MVICVYYFDEYLQQNDSHKNIANYILIFNESKKKSDTHWKKLIFQQNDIQIWGKLQKSRIKIIFKIFHLNINYVNMRKIMNIFLNSWD